MDYAKKNEADGIICSQDVADQDISRPGMHFSDQQPLPIQMLTPVSNKFTVGGQTPILCNVSLQK